MGQRRLGFWRRFAVALVLPVLTVWTKRTWTGMENIPATGGLIIVPNHESHFDPLVVAHYIYGAHRWPRFLGKASLWKVPVLGFLLRKVQQIPVERGSVEAVKSLDALVEALDKDGVVVIYPEGTTTRHPDLWPMRGKTGAARVALRTGCPVIPIGQWGVQDLLPPYGRPDLFPRKTIKVKAGDPVDLADLRDVPVTNDVLREATERIMAAISSLVADLRGEPAPAERFDPRKAGVRQTGNPNRGTKRKRGAR